MALLLLLLDQCSWSRMGSSGTFLLVLAAMAVGVQAQELRPSPDPLIIIGGGTYNLTCMNSYGDTNSQPVNWQFTFSVGPRSLFSYHTTGQYNETMVLNVNQSIYSTLTTNQATVSLDCYAGAPPAKFPTLDFTRIDLYRDLCQDPTYCAMDNYPLGSTDCKSSITRNFFTTRATFSCTCSPGDAGAPCREVRDCMESPATPVPERDCNPRHITVLRMTIPHNNIINGST
eukprot:scpid99243/ scgid4760/ 